MKRIFTLGIVGLILLLPQLVSAEEVEILDLTKSIVKLEAEILRIGPTDDNGGATINSSENELRDLGNGTVSGFRSAVTTGGRTSRHSKSNARTLPVRDAEYSSKDLISWG